MLPTVQKHPTRPSTPRRRIAAAIGVAIGLSAAFAIGPAALADDPVIRGVGHAHDTGCPPWFAGASGLVMTRSLPSGEPAASWPGGVELFVGRWFGERQRHGVEAIYWGVYGIDSTPTSPTPSSDASRSDMVNDVEINWLFAPGGRPEFHAEGGGPFTLVGLAGFRFFELEDVLSLSDPSAASGITEASTNTNNNLFGGQIGGKLDWHVAPSIRLSAVPKAMLAGNAVTNTTSITTGSGSSSEHVSDSVFSWLGSVDAAVTWDVTRAWSLWIGYRVVGVNEIAQVGSSWTDAIASGDVPAAPDADSSTIVHGGFAGFQGRF